MHTNFGTWFFFFHVTPCCPTFLLTAVTIFHTVHHVLLCGWNVRTNHVEWNDARLDHCVWQSNSVHIVLCVLCVGGTNNRMWQCDRNSITIWQKCHWGMVFFTSCSPPRPRQQRPQMSTSWSVCSLAVWWLWWAPPCLSAWTSTTSRRGRRSATTVTPTTSLLSSLTDRWANLTSEDQTLMGSRGGKLRRPPAVGCLRPDFITAYWPHIHLTAHDTILLAMCSL